MGSFSIYHWLIVALIFSPIIIGFLIMGLQQKVILKHTQSGLVKNGFFGYSWTYLIFGWFVPVVRGEIGIGLLHLILTMISFGLFQLIMPFLYNKQFTTRLLLNNWELSDSDEKNNLARIKLGIAF